MSSSLWPHGLEHANLCPPLSPESEHESESRSVMSTSLQPHGLYSSWNFPGQNTGVGSLSLLQGIIPTQELNGGLPHYRRILYQLSYQGSPELSPEVCSHLCPVSQCYYLTISSSVIPFFSCLQSFPASKSFSSELALRIKWPKYWSFIFSISPSNDILGLFPLRFDSFDLLAVQGTLKSSPAPQFKSISSSALRLLYGPTLTSVHDYWKNHSFDYMNLCQQSNVSAFKYAV